jgi:hypothetical protein
MFSVAKRDYTSYGGRMELKEYIESIEEKIRSTYEEGVTIEQAEKLASEFLNSQIVISRALAEVDLDSRMKKAGVKAIRAAVYLEECKKSDKKPSDVLLDAIVNSNDIVLGEQGRLDEAEVKKAELDRAFSILQNAHIHYRTIAKGAFSS